MARFVSALLLCGGCVVSAGSLAQAGLVDPGSLPVINGHVTLEEYRTLPSNPALASCSDPRCNALRSLISSYDKLRRFYTPNTMARSEDNPPPTKRPRLPVQETVSDDSGAKAAVAGDLAVIARDIPEWSTEMLTIEIATLTDASGQTVQRIIDAMPKTPALAGVVKAAREHCEVTGNQGCKAIGNAG